MKKITPDQWLDQYFAGEYFSGEFSHLKKLIEDLNLHTGYQKIITIAGTNGKGETSRRLSRRLFEYQKSYACFTSPHLFSVVERFHFNGENIATDELIGCFKKTKDSLVNLKRTLSFFEFLFLNFLFLCRQKNISILVLEVGLGGRLDATNCLDADICAITSISRDHQELLGKTYKSILNEKMGILRPKKILVSALELNYLQNLVAKKTQALTIDWIDGFKEKQVSSITDFSRRNKYIADTIFALVYPSIEKYADTEKLSVEESVGDKSNAQLGFSKRLELKIKDYEFDFYSSHNIDGVRKLVHFLAQAKYTQYNNLIISFSDRDLADLRVMVKILLNYFETAKIYLYEFSHVKAVSSNKLLRIKDDFKLEITNKNKIQELLSTNAGSRMPLQGKTLCTGSQYFFADLSLALKGHIYE